MNNIIITLDVDWSPDFMITKVADKLIENKVKATWFVTHNSPAIRRLFQDPNLFEIGVHPNFMSRTTQGADYYEVMNYIMKIALGAKAVRTHGLFQSSSIMRMMTVNFGLEIDSSIYLREAPNIIPVEAYYDDKVLLRIPFFWTEDGEMYKPNPSFLLDDKNLDLPGLKIFAFHPIHVYLNSKNMRNYSSLDNRYSIQGCTENEAEQYVDDGIGANSLFDELIQYILDTFNGSKTISDISSDWKNLKVGK